MKYVPTSKDLLINMERDRAIEQGERLPSQPVLDL